MAGFAPLQREMPARIVTPARPQPLGEHLEECQVMEDTEQSMINMLQLYDRWYRRQSLAAVNWEKPLFYCIIFSSVAGKRCFLSDCSLYLTGNKYAHMT